MFICSGYGYGMSGELYTAFDVFVSLSVVVAVMFAHKLVNHVELLNYQRSLFSKRILSAVLRAEERSRTSFAKELHDGMGPLLSSAKMSLSAMSVENMSEEQQQILRNTRFLIDEAIRSVREISNNVSPQVLSDFGLAHGLRNFLSRISQLNVVNIAFNTNIDKERFDSNTEVVLYRVVCELINNSLKHSGCSEIEISLMLSGTLIKLEYSDNGCGFNLDEVASNGMGLSNITSRIDSINGSIEIQSRKGEGMSVVASIETAAVDNVPKSVRKRWRER
jgi:signal transduction histidine kinase